MECKRFIVALLFAIACSSTDGPTDVGPSDETTQIMDTWEVKSDILDLVQDQNTDPFEALTDCTNETVPTTPIGGHCESDCDCPPDLFCYMEGYPGASHVCTRECAGDCGSSNKCIVFSPKHWQKYNLVHHTICMPYCLSMADCAVYGDHFTYCPGKSAYTMWEDSTLAPSTCQVVKTE